MTPIRSHRHAGTSQTFIVLRRGPAGRAEPHRLAVPAPRLQHRLAHRRPHRAARRLAHHAGGPGGRRRRARLEANLYKLVNVLRVEDVPRRPRSCGEMALVKVRAAPIAARELLQLCEVFRARVVDVGPASMIFEITGARTRSTASSRCFGPSGSSRWSAPARSRCSAARSRLPFPQSRRYDIMSQTDPFSSSTPRCATASSRRARRMTSPRSSRSRGRSRARRRRHRGGLSRRLARRPRGRAARSRAARCDGAERSAASRARPSRTSTRALEALGARAAPAHPHLPRHQPPSTASTSCG